jgi:predicted nucleic acid-binding protein
MVIPDTSVWIEFFKGNEPYFKVVHNLIETRSVLTIEPIFGELLQGALNKAEATTIKSFWQYLSKPDIPELFIKAGELAYKEKLVSKGIKLVDAAIIYTTIENNCMLWTLDKKILNYLNRKYIYNPNLQTMP